MVRFAGDVLMCENWKPGFSRTRDAGIRDLTNAGPARAVITLERRRKMRSVSRRGAAAVVLAVILSAGGGAGQPPRRGPAPPALRGLPPVERPGNSWVLPSSRGEPAYGLGGPLEDRGVSAPGDLRVSRGPGRGRRCTRARCRRSVRPAASATRSWSISSITSGGPGDTKPA